MMATAASTRQAMIAAVPSRFQTFSGIFVLRFIVFADKKKGRLPYWETAPDWRVSTRFPPRGGRIR